MYVTSSFHRTFITCFVFLLFFFLGGQVLADDTPTPTPSATPTPNGSPTPTPDTSKDQVNELQSKISDLQNKVSGLKSQEQTLSSAIDVMDNQIKLTQYKMDATEEQITSLTDDIGIAEKKVTNLDGSLNEITKALIARVRQSYQIGSIQPMQILLTSGNISNFVTQLNYLRIIQAHDKRLIYDTVQAKNDYASQKQLFVTKKQQVEDLKKQLEGYATDLNTQKDSKKKLLTETQGSEATYEQLLSQARAQLAGFSKFVESQGGASLLSGQTVCDDWGCYYNQRDSQWGGAALDGTQYTIASDGCLMTDMAMVFTHYGHRGVTPSTINSNSQNFASYEPAWLLKTIYADGATASRSSSDIDSELSAGRPVIVGISYDSGPIADHFVTLVSGSGGSYIMNDPFLPNGHNISFNDHYSMGSIREIDRVTVQ